MKNCAKFYFQMNHSIINLNDIIKNSGIFDELVIYILLYL